MGQVIKKMSNGRFIGWYIRWRENGRRICIASKQPTAAAARKMLVQIEAKAAQQSRDVTIHSSITVAELCDQFLASSHPRAKCPVEYRRQARQDLASVLPLVGKLKLAELRRRDLERVRDALSARYKPNTVRAALRPISAALTWAVRQELIAQSPASRLELPRREQSVEHLSLDDAQKLLAEAARRAQQQRRWHSLYVAVSLALRLGLRRGEVYGLRWEDVNIKQRRLNVARSYKGLTKNGKPRTLPISDDLARVLELWRPLCPVQPLVCPLGVKARNGLGWLLRSAGCRPLARGWHSLRHSFATLWIEQGGSIMTLKEMLGHATLNQVLVYAHVSPSALAVDLAKMKL